MVMHQRCLVRICHAEQGRSDACRHVFVGVDQGLFPTVVDNTGLTRQCRDTLLDAVVLLPADQRPHAHFCIAWVTYGDLGKLGGNGFCNRIEISRRHQCTPDSGAALTALGRHFTHEFFYVQIESRRTGRRVLTEN